MRASSLPCRWRITLPCPTPSRWPRDPFVSGAAVRRQAKHWIGELRIKTPGPQALLRQLSGGNQQKVVFSRALASGADILLLNHPTRGVDVGAKGGDLRPDPRHDG